MKRILSLILLCTLAAGLLSGCAGEASRELTAGPDMDITLPDLSGTETAGVSTLNGFGLELLKETRRQEGGQVLVSPLSALLALSMAANGAEGDTLAQFEAVLGGTASLEELNAACAGLLNDYGSLGGSTQCTIANSIWVDPKWQVGEDFIARCRQIFGAQAFQMTLTSPDAVREVNSWVSEHTNGLIPKIVDEPFNSAAALLVNALYLKNAWASAFSANSTRERSFQHKDGTIETMDFLNKRDVDLLYLQGEEAQGVILPYDDGRLGFFALMPDAPELEPWLEGLEGAALEALLTGAKNELFCRLAMPKFETEWRGSLKKILEGMGLTLAFVPNQADFSRLGDNPEGYYIGQVIHAAKLQVNEKGTEAAAATVVSVAPTSSAPMPEPQGITLILDHPFLYGIVDLETGFPLFLGTLE